MLHPGPTRDTTRVGVTVTFLRMDRRPMPGPTAALPLPADASIVRLDRCSVPFYRFLYGTVGGDYVWWLRRTVSDAALSGLLAEPGVEVHVLYQGGEPAGFFELDRRAMPTVNLSYFGLMPRGIGRGLGGIFLSAALHAAWGPGTRAVTVNTCTADHPRALPGYLRAGFQPVRRADEVWDVPNHLGLVIPPHLRA